MAVAVIAGAMSAKKWRGETACHSLTMRRLIRASGSQGQYLNVATYNSCAPLRCFAMHTTRPALHSPALTLHANIRTGFRLYLTLSLPSSRDFGTQARCGTCTPYTGQERAFSELPATRTARPAGCGAAAGLLRGCSAAAGMMQGRCEVWHGLRGREPGRDLWAAVRFCKQSKTASRHRATYTMRLSTL